MKILAIEFSSAQRSVAVFQADTGRDALARGPSSDSGSSPGRASMPAVFEGKVNEVVETGAGGAAALAMIDEVLRQGGLEREQIERLVVGLGPGSYTGIRAAIALAQGWQLSGGTEVLGLSTAECLARHAQALGVSGGVSIVIDAQREEFYLARYELSAEICREREPLRLASRRQVEERQRAGEILIGPEVTRWFAGGRILIPSAAWLARMALRRNDVGSAENLQPIYLRETQFVKAPRGPAIT
jgi:tRNA threonylcarbamoyladenosine biosynthesis protein TsaB